MVRGPARRSRYNRRVTVQGADSVYFFVAFAVIVWFACFRLRRKWRAVGVCALALGILVGVAFFHWKLNQWTNGRIYLPVMQTILYPYIVFVVGIGLYIAALPNGVASHLCEYCRYDMSGLEEPLCPECGRADERVAAIDRELVCGTPEPVVEVRTAGTVIPAAS